MSITTGIAPPCRTRFPDKRGVGVSLKLVLFSDGVDGVIGLARHDFGVLFTVPPLYATIMPATGSIKVSCGHTERM